MESERIKVLIVDDSDMTRKALGRIVEGDSRLTLCGTARNGYEAVALVPRLLPHVILMDIEMESKLAGLYASREILREDPGIKVIIHSRHKSELYISKAFQFGAVDYLVKETPGQEIVRTVVRVHENRGIIHAEAAATLRADYIRLKNLQEHLADTMQVLLRLTPTELDILRLMHSGMKQREIAKVRFIELSTMKTHVSNVIKKFDRKSIAEVLKVVEETGFFLLAGESD